MQEDRSPAFVLDVTGISFPHVEAKKAANVPSLVLINVEDLSIDHCLGTADVQAAKKCSYLKPRFFSKAFPRTFPSRGGGGVFSSCTFLLCASCSLLDFCFNAAISSARIF